MTFMYDRASCFNTASASSSASPSSILSPDIPTLVWLSSLLAPGLTSKELCLKILVPPMLPLVLERVPRSSRPADMHGSKLLRMAVNFLSGPSSTRTFPPALFHAFATSSSTRSARPSSRHPLPQNLPTNVDRRLSPEDVSVRLYF